MQKRNKIIAKYLIFLVFLSFFSCISSNQEEVKYLKNNQRAFLNYSKLLRLTVKEKDYLNIPIDISKYNTIKKIKIFRDTICQQFENNDNFDNCLENLYIRYNYEDNSFNPNKNEKYNVNIPAISISCHMCCIQFKETEDVYIEYRKDTVYINNSFNNTIDTLLFDTEKMNNRIESMFNKKISQFFEACRDYKEHEKTDDDFNDYIENLDYLPLNIKLSISDKSKTTDLEPLFVIIYKNYLKTLDEQIFKFTNHKIEELTNNEIKLFGKNIGLNIKLSRPINEMFLYRQKIKDINNLKEEIYINE